MARIEKWVRNGKQIVYFDLSDIKSNDELVAVVAAAKEAVGGYEHASVYSITNISRIAFDTKTKEIAADWMAFNKPYVKQASFIGVSGVRKIMMQAVFALSKRDNVRLFHEMDEALAWIDTL